MARIKIGNVKCRPAVGMHHVQFLGEPTPAEIYPNTVWEIDTTMQGRTIIGSGGDYTFGDTGGEEKHKMTRDEMYKHNHGLSIDNGSETSLNDQLSLSYGSGWRNYIGGAIEYAGSTQPFNIMQPYVVINFWKCTA